MGREIPHATALARNVMSTLMTTDTKEITIAALSAVNSLAMLGTVCYCWHRLMRYWEARLPYHGPEVLPGTSITRVSIAEQQEQA